MAALRLSGQTVNIMTLGGLALAIGILVDEATVTIENIHTHLSKGEGLARAVRSATDETMVARFLAMLCIVAVFIPAFLMTGAARNLFVPLAMAVGFSMLGSYLLSSSLVPVLSIWVLRRTEAEQRGYDAVFDRLRKKYAALARFLVARRRLVTIFYLVSFGAVISWSLAARSAQKFPTRRYRAVSIAFAGAVGNAHRTHGTDRPANARCHQARGWT